MAKKKIKKTIKKSVKNPAKKTAKNTAKKAAPKKAVKKKPLKKAAAKKATAPAAPKVNQVNPYLNFQGNCEEAFNLYRSVFGGKFAFVGRFKEMPPMDGKTMSPGQGEKIMHISLPISKETILMGSDTSEEFGHVTTIGNNFSISITAKSINEADRLYKGLSVGGNPVMPMSKTFWGSYFGMLTDKFGIMWMISFG